jgi:uncharacterized protein (TIGR01777 family)
MRILISGSTGFLGTAITDALVREGHTFVRLVRPTTAISKSASASSEVVHWNPSAEGFDSAADAAVAEGADALIHLAGASIASGRWNASRKTLLRTSRVDATRNLVAALSRLQRPPRVVVAASAIGYYGNRGDQLLTEPSPPGNDFLSVLCREWEIESSKAAVFGARVVMLRFGIILSTHGGALPRMAMPFKFGAGGTIGSGQQWMSWLTLEEAVNIVRFVLSNATLTGAANAVSPEPLQNKNFTRVLANTLHRPAIFPVPAFALKLLLGEMADALLLSSQRVLPEKLTKSGYVFLQPDLAAALRKVFGE